MASCPIKKSEELLGRSKAEHELQANSPTHKLSELISFERTAKTSEGGDDPPPGGVDDLSEDDVEDEDDDDDDAATWKSWPCPPAHGVNEANEAMELDPKIGDENPKIEAEKDSNCIEKDVGQMPNMDCKGSTHAEAESLHTEAVRAVHPGAYLPASDAAHDDLTCLAAAVLLELASELIGQPVQLKFKGCGSQLFDGKVVAAMKGNRFKVCFDDEYTAVYSKRQVLTGLVHRS